MDDEVCILFIYTSTTFELALRVTVTREGEFRRSTLEVVDETEIYKGADNRLTMNQTT